jgi:tRNA pseudouridine55 synthase
MARRGESVPTLPKKVRVSRLEFGPLDGGRLPFTVSCSSGTYIRSIAAEMGEQLGCGGHLEALRRTRIGEFGIDDALALEAFERMAPAERLASPHAVPLSDVRFPFERVRLASLEAWKIRRGQAIAARGVAAREGDWVTLVGPADEMVALGQIAPAGTHKVSFIRPRIVLAE